jgi:capsid protein
MRGIIRKVAKFAYDAVTPKNKRRAPTGILRAEDGELTAEQRKRLISGARDLPRNFSVAAWMIRRHLDYVSTFSFQAKSGNLQLDTKVEYLMGEWSHRRNCEVTARHRLSRLIRLLENRRVIDGDVFVLKLADGRIQIIEGDRVRTPNGGFPVGGSVSPSDFTGGVKLDEYGAAEAYSVCKRGKTTDLGSSSTFTFERLLSAEHVIHHGYWERSDQVRGISPLASAIASLQDTYEVIDYAVAKMKVEQLFALALYRDADDAVGEATTDSETGRVVKDFGDGPVTLDLDKEDKAEFLESKNPSTNSQAFIQTLIQISLKALDIPYSFYAENYSNYSGARQALLQYQQSADIKRQDNRDLLDELTRWKIEQWADEGLITEEELTQVYWDWIPTGLPWIDPLKEIAAQKEAIKEKLDSRQRICRSLGRDFFDIVDEQADEEAYMIKKGLAVNPESPEAKPPTEPEPDTTDKKEEPLDGSQIPDEE